MQSWEVKMDDFLKDYFENGNDWDPDRSLKIMEQDRLYDLTERIRKEIMSSLEKVVSLDKELFSMKLINPSHEESYEVTEEAYDSRWSNGITRQTFTEYRTVPDEYGPDRTKRINAGKELLPLYESTPWQSIRYAIGKRLDSSLLDKTDVEKELETWIINAALRRSGASEENRIKLNQDAKILLDEVKVPIERGRQLAHLLGINQLDFLKRYERGMQLNESELDTIYDNPTQFSPEDVKYAGRRLGNSEMKVWMRAYSNQIKLISMSIPFIGTSIAAIGGFGYLLYQSLPK